jgi:hypothetical protein
MNLMLGRNPLFVAQQHGHSVLTMLSVYAAWTRGSPEADVVLDSARPAGPRLRSPQG